MAVATLASCWTAPYCSEEEATLPVDCESTDTCTNKEIQTHREILDTEKYRATDKYIGTDKYIDTDKYIGTEKEDSHLFLDPGQNLPRLCVLAHPAQAPDRYQKY